MTLVSQLNEHGKMVTVFDPFRWIFWLRKMPEFKITQREYELDRWVDNEEDEYETDFYDIDFEG